MRSRTCLWNWLGALSPSISHELSQGFWVCGSRDTGNKEHARCFPLRFITLMSHVSWSWGGGVNSYRAEKKKKRKKHINRDLSIFRLLTPSFKSLISKGCGGENRLLYVWVFTRGSANVWYAFAVKILHYDIFQFKRGGQHFLLFEKLSAISVD